MEDHLDLNTIGDPLENNTPIKQEKNLNDWKKGSRLLSGLVGCNVLLFSGALLTCVFVEDIDIFEKGFFIFLTTMMAICILWMLFQMYFTWRNKNAVLYKDCQAGPIWMRAGIIFFGVGALIMTSLKIAYTAEYKDCVTPLKIIQPVMQGLFIIVQTCFLWLSCKHCVQIYSNVTRCFLMVLLAVNLTIWIITVTEESKHQTNELQEYLYRNHSQEHLYRNHSEEHLYRNHSQAHLYRNHSETKSQDAEENVNSCGCSYKCAVDKTFFIYLYPFTIEYNLFAAAMIYIMWKNVERKIDENALFHHGLGPGVRQHIPLLGLFSGLAILITGLVMFILYEVGKDNPQKNWLSLTTFYCFQLFSLALMCLANMVGIIIFRLDKRNMDNQKNPSRTLDTVLLLLASLGQYGFSYYSIIAMVSTVPFVLMCGLTLSYSLLLIVQHSLQNAFIIEGLHRLPPSNLLNAHPGTSHPRAVEQHDPLRRRSVPEKESRLSITSPPRMSRRETLTHNIKSHLKKRKTMKDVYLFLFLCNLIFWIMPSFGARIRFDTGLEVNFYGFSMWAIITNICLPFGIFYRMHAAASLLELYSMA
ncbi:proton channel OTOP2-like [Rana temporaria]|uniref:proton channel OTOP2-like n=1 Tax=Rana temporaria TaxID=8407 RepID=UPI001AADD811|nr:proton channel OTOP2-like [Rana temporaria]